MSKIYNINNKLIYGSYGLITACEPYTPSPPEPDPYNPLNLPTNTIRCKFSSGYTPGNKKVNLI